MHAAIVFAGFVLFAVSYNLFGPLAADIMASLGMSLSDGGRLVSYQQMGSIGAILLSYLVLRRMKQRRIVRFGHAAIVVALALVAFSSSTNALYAAYVIIGVGSFMVDSASNALLTEQYFEKRSTYIPLLHFCYSAGAIVTGYVLLPFKGPMWRMAYGVTGAAIALILAASFFTRPKQTGLPHLEEKVEPCKAERGLTLVKDPAFILYTLVIALYMGSQLLCATWIPVYVELERNMGATITASSLTVFWVGTAVSRLIVGPLMNHGAKPYRLSMWGMVLAGLSLIGATVTAVPALVLTFTALCGFFAGATIPMYLVVAPSWYPHNAAFISTSYIFGGTLGRMVFPYMVTRIAEGSSLAYSLRLSSILLFISAILIAIVSRVAKGRAAA